jgi:hypothetical protein
MQCRKGRVKHLRRMMKPVDPRLDLAVLLFYLFIQSNCKWILLLDNVPQLLLILLCIGKVSGQICIIILGVILLLANRSFNLEHMKNKNTFAINPSLASFVFFLPALISVCLPVRTPLACIKLLISPQNFSFFFLFDVLETSFFKSATFLSILSA